MHGLILASAEHLRTAGFDPLAHLSRALRATRKALTAELDEGEPDHPTRLKAADQIYRLCGAYPDRDSDRSDTSKPVSVTIILAATPRAALPGDGVRFHLRGDAGHGP